MAMQVNKGSIYVNKNRVETAKTKKPTIKDTKDKTIQEWKSSYDRSFGAAATDLPVCSIDEYQPPEELI